MDFDLSKHLNGLVDGWESLAWTLSPEYDVRRVIQLHEQHQIDVVVIDHYRADATYQRRLHQSGVRWLQIDGSAEGPLWADWVLNTTPSAEPSIYVPLMQRGGTRLLLGPTYALLRREFQRWRLQAEFRQQVRKILLTFGGGDDRGATIFCLEAIRSLEPSIERIVLVSSANPQLDDIVSWADAQKHSNTTLRIDEHEVARCMADADLAITAGGTTTFETATMGLPSMIIQISDDQALNAEAWERSGIAKNLGPLQSLKAGAFESHVRELIGNVEIRRSMVRAGRELVDPLGASRVAQELLAEF